MKKIVLIFIVFAFVANVSAQLEVNTLGDTYLYGNSYFYESTYFLANIYLGGPSNIVGTTNNIPITFKVNNVLSGYTGYSGNSNVSFGYEALLNPSPGNGNTAVGYRALRNSTGYNNTATGYYALYHNTTGQNNIATGYYSLYSNTTGNHNIANGAFALYKNTTGYSNTANGYYSLYSNTTGNGNVANGFNALYSNTTGIGNVANGFNALYSNTTGNGNVATGYYALSNNTTGSGNIAAGYFALGSNTTGSYNTFIGCAVGANTGNLSNATAIGNGAIVDASNTVVIGNSTITSASVGTSVFWSTTSDGRTKKNIREDVPGLAFIKQLKPITYKLDLEAVDELQKSDDPKINAFRDSLRIGRSPEEKEIEAKARANKEKQVYSGFIAQDVEKTAKSIGYDFIGVDAPENDKGIYGLRYTAFVVPLVKAVQELSEQNDAKDATIASLQEQVNELTGLIYRLIGKEPNELRSGSSEQSVTGLRETTVGGASLQQNIPNPFNQTTVIRYSLPQGCNSAQIIITNTAGRVVQQIPLSVSDKLDSITIEGGSLTAGIYFYTLICDGNLVDTKRMILTE